MNDSHKPTLRLVLRHARVVAFVRSVVRENYRKYFADHEEVTGMVDRAFDRLVESHGEEDPDALLRCVTGIQRDIFRKDNPDFWFNQLYAEYKKRIRPRLDFTRLQPYLLDRRVLDYGSGGGYLALEMARQGYDVLTTDVLDYRVPEARSLLFRPMTTPGMIPYPDDSADTAIVKAVLHHIDSDNLGQVLSELRRVSRRLVIEEDTYGIPASLEGVPEISQTQPQFRRFMALNPGEQFEALMLIDYFANAITQGVVEMNFPFQFKSIPQWTEVLQANGLTISQVKLLGFQPGMVNRSCHVWLICDRAIDTTPPILPH